MFLCQIAILKMPFLKKQGYDDLIFFLFLLLYFPLKLKMISMYCQLVNQ